MITENNTIVNECIYSDDRAHRYLMSRIWDKDKPITMFVTKTSGTANGIVIELTNNIITNNLYKLGYGGYYAVNLCSAIERTIDPQYARYDAHGHMVNDPYPTADTIWASGGFDLTGVAVMHDIRANK